MSKPTPMSPEAKKEYWMKRLISKANSVFPQFQKDVNEIVNMAIHSGAEDHVRAGIRSLVIEQTLQITAKLIPPQKENYDPTKGPNPTPGSDQPTMVIPAGPSSQGVSGQKEGEK